MAMSNHMYKVIELIGTSPESFEKAASTAVEEAAKHLNDLRIAEVTQMDLQIVEGKVVAYRTKVKVSFKYHPSEE
jgi:flavin-binding protein dodecin